MKHHHLGAVAAVATVLLTACGGGNSGADSSVATAAALAVAPVSSAPAAAGSAVMAPMGLVKAGTLSVCLDPEYAPMEYYENGTDGEIVGFDADGARALAESWGLGVELQATAFDGLLPAMNANRCDIVWSGLNLSDKRLEVADGVAYLNTGPTLVVAAGNPTGATDLASLCGLMIAVQAGSTNESIVSEQGKACEAEGKPGLSVQSYPETAETFAAVTNGKADALVETDVVVPAKVSKSGGMLEEVSNVFKTTSQFAVYVNKGSELLPALQEAITALIADGTFADVASKYGLDPAKVAQ